MRVVCWTPAGAGRDAGQGKGRGGLLLTELTAAGPLNSQRVRKTKRPGPLVHPPRPTKVKCLSELAVQLQARAAASGGQRAAGRASSQQGHHISIYGVDIGHGQEEDGGRPKFECFLLNSTILRVGGGRETQRSKAVAVHAAAKMTEAAETATEITCGICLEDSKDPLDLPCGHSFCEGCLDEWRSRT